MSVKPVKLRRQNSRLGCVQTEVPGDLLDSLRDVLSKVDPPNVAHRKRRYRDRLLLITQGVSDYECTIEELQNHQNPMLSPPRHSHPVTLDQATERLESALAQPTSIPECPALARLNRFFNAPPNDNWGPDIVFKAFADLDLLFFMGELRGHVYLRWTDHEEDRHTAHFGIHHLVPAGDNLVASGKSVINMASRPLLLRNPRITVGFVIETFLHEMVVSAVFTDSNILLY